jgi:hypothetical protein
MYPQIREAPDKAVPDGILRKPEFAVQKNFEYLNDKFWHRYMLPFGCYFYNKPPETHQGWKDWCAGLRTPPGKDVCISPYSVTFADVLYLANTTGWVDRFIFTLGVILWAKCYGCNLLRYYRTHLCTTDHTFRAFVSLERHLHLFGSIHLLRSVLRENTHAVGGNWTETLSILNQMETECCQNFFVMKNSLATHLDSFLIKESAGNLSLMVSVFPKCGRIKDGITSRTLP